MKTFKFHKSKYGRELLMDLGSFRSTPQFFFEKIPHTVDFYEIFFFDKANGTLQLDNSIIELEDQLVVFASPYQRRIWNVDKAGMEGYFLIFANNFLELFFTDPLFVFRLQFYHNSQTPLSLEESQRAFNRHHQAFESMTTELQNLQSDSEDLLRAYLLLILADLNRKYCRKYGLSADRHRNQEAFQFKKLVEQKIRHYQKVDEYARVLNISRITLNKLVKSQFGITATQFIKRRLLTEVKRELLFTANTIAEIAYELNFSEASSLIRFFTNMEGVSPTDYRTTYQNVNHLIKT